VSPFSIIWSTLCRTPTTAPYGRFLPLVNRREPVEVTEDLVGTVDEVNDNFGSMLHWAKTPEK
jgi:hypothetical protein